jgi:AAA domain
LELARQSSIWPPQGPDSEDSAAAAQAEEQTKTDSSADDPAPGPLPRFYAWPELLKRPHRELLVPDLLFTKGITTLTGTSGGGKTTLAQAIAMTVATGGTWAGKRIKPRPVLWIAAEGQDDLRGMYQAWMQLHPGCGTPPGCFCDEPIDFSQDWKMKEFVEKVLVGLPPMLIVADALCDVMGNLKENEAKDIHLIYENFRKVRNANGNAVLVLHHSGWEKDRERGSSALRPENDILVHVKSFDAVKGEVKLMHNKRRGGVKLDEFTYEVKLTLVVGCEQPVPVVTGVLKTRTMEDILNEPCRRSENAMKAFVVLRMKFPHGALRQEWLEAWQEVKGGSKAKGASDDVFDRAKTELIVEGVVEADGKGKGTIYRVKSATKEAGSEGAGNATQDEKQNTPQDSPHSAPFKGGAEECGAYTPHDTPQCGANAEELTPGCGFEGATKTNSGIPSDADIIAQEQEALAARGPGSKGERKD